MTRASLIEQRIAEAVALVRLGFHLLPLHGKRPAISAWPSAPAMSETDAVAWAEHDNCGVNAGASGLLVVDVDSARGATWTSDALTWTSRTGSGGEHLFFRMPVPALGNSSGRIAPHVDTRGVGGQACAPGSVHPDTGELYLWTIPPGEVPLAALPPDIEAALRPAPVAPLSRPALPPRPLSVGYIESAWEDELHRLASTPAGSRGTALNRAAYALGRFVHAGQLDRASLVSALLIAADHNGLLATDGERAVLRTIENALAASQRIAS